MRHYRQGTVLGVLAAVGLLCWSQAGCVTLFPHSSSVPGPRKDQAHPDVPTIAKGSHLEWSVLAAGQPRQGMSGQGIVGAEGSLEMGPYGTVHVAGLTVKKAEAVVQKQLRHYLKDPRVQLRVVQAQAPLAPNAPLARGPLASWSSDESAGQPGTLTWRPSGGQLRLVSSQGGPDLGGPLLSVGDEPLPRLKKQGPATGKQPPAGRPEETKAPRPLPHQPTLSGPPPLVLAGPPPGPWDIPREGRQVTLPPYVIGPPDILQIDSLQGLKTHPVQGPHLVRPDGTVGLGGYGQVYVAGMTIDQARQAIAQVIHARLNRNVITLRQVIEGLSVDVLAYNSKVFYVITDGGGYGEQVTRLPITGNETVLDAISLNPVRTGIYGLPPVSSKHHIWVARPGHDGHDQILPVDWVGISQRGQTATNYQLLPGDRLYVRADKWRTFNATVDKIVSPFERMLGVTLLGSETVNSIRTGGTAVVP
jgi:polysaccharide export outer membrane protein